jgi:hypothetical protein
VQAAIFPEFFGCRPATSVSRSLFSSPVQHLAPVIVRSSRCFAAD